ncbi:hypothetical protein T484DRAFT_1795167, partial [Baffinella frigidus]
EASVHPSSVNSKLNGDEWISPYIEASVHPSSVNSKLNGDEWISPYIVFHERVQTTKVYIRDCSPVPPLAILLFGGGELIQGADGLLSVDNWLGITGADGLLSVDNWLGITVPPQEAQQICDLRERLGDVLNRMVHRRAGTKLLLLLLLLVLVLVVSVVVLVLVLLLLLLLRGIKLLVALVVVVLLLLLAAPAPAPAR